MMRRGLLWLVVTALAGLLVVVAPPASADEASLAASGTDAHSTWGALKDRATWVRRPVLKQRGFADPSVVRWHGTYVGVATGRLAPRAKALSPAGPWRAAGTALARRPRWASGRNLWAGDLVRVGRRWVLYFAAPVRGLGPNGRCIGVAVARKPTARFHPVGGGPLVCPRAAHTPRAGDPMVGRGAALPQRGAIDAESFRAGRRRYLVYRTQGRPSTIRMVRLSGDGLRARRGGASRQLVRAPHIVENPVLLRRGRGYVLLASEGSYGDCDYRTTWRRTTHLWDWSHARAHRLLDRAGTGLCGPGGADVVDSRALRRRTAHRALIVLHAWTCPGLGTCRSGDYRLDPTPGARRSMYAAWLWWSRGRPYVTSFVLPTRLARPDM